MYGTIEIAKHRAAQVDQLHLSGDAGNIYDIAFAVLVLDQNEDSADEVLYQALRPEAHGQADQAGRRQQCADIDAELRKDREKADKGREELDRSIGNVGQRLHPLVDLGLRFVLHLRRHSRTDRRFQGAPDEPEHKVESDDDNDDTDPRCPERLQPAAPIDVCEEVTHADLPFALFRSPAYTDTPNRRTRQALAPGPNGLMQARARVCVATGGC